ncbi:class D beta-lactamase [Neobacillus cucumis]|uniref:class D beta-lactamase n=1 Tax=Neobacillus cucumis TaxID=1740721 RepID=UPI0018DF7D8B|nr:class D beta-lactamase [Neobacillus cucumis]MBI0579466.1 class D beta-lactamase [Neobacillus cucumis]
MGWRRILAYLVVITFAATILLTFNSKSYAEKNDVFVKKHNVVYEDLSSYFTGFSGTFVMYDIEHKQYTIYNKAKSVKRLSPNSTFKVPHALFGLQTGVLDDENTTFQWDGTEYPFPQWNQDQTLTQAIQNSTIWYFQEVSSRLGENREQYFLHRIHYGNEDISGGLTHFWLQSSLEISPIEQVDFLKRFYTYQLPFTHRNIDIVKKILVMDQKDGALLSGKTGTGWKDGVINGIPVNGNFIGYVEKDGNAYIFATNIEADNLASSSKAKQITLQILKDKKIFE